MIKYSNFDKKKRYEILIIFFTTEFLLSEFFLYECMKTYIFLEKYFNFKYWGYLFKIQLQNFNKKMTFY